VVTITTASAHSFEAKTFCILHFCNQTFMNIFMTGFVNNGQTQISQLRDIIMKLDFKWQVTGQKHNDDILSVEIYGHVASCIKSFDISDSDDWWISLDGNKISGLKGKKGAQDYVEKLIRNKIEARITLARSEYDLFGFQKNQPEPLAINANLGPNYLSLADFKRYIESNVKSALEIVGTELKNPNKLNLIAAKMLGYKSYEAIQPLHHREKMINEALHVERCTFQNNRITIKATNIIVVFDHIESKIFFRPLSSGQEFEFVNEDNCFNLFDLGDIQINTDIVEYKLSLASKELLNPQVDVVFKDAKGGEHAFLVKRTYEGLIFDIIYDYKGDSGSMGTHSVAFDDADTEHLADQISPLLNRTLPSDDGEYYQWLKKIEIDDAVRYIHINPKEEVDISNIMFTSHQEAVQGITNEYWGIGKDDILEHNCVLVKVSKALINNADSLLHYQVDF
jgi:hypothetical protein